MGIVATRFYAIVLIISVTVLAFYSSLTVHVVTVTTSYPSRDTFEHLYQIYPLTLTCPCSQIAIPQEKMVDILSPRFHQVRNRILENKWLSQVYKA